MQYKSRKDYIADCITAAVGSFLDENYSARDFEDVIGFATDEQATCSNFINFVKNTEDKNYITQTNFNAYLCEKASADFTLSDVQASISDIIFEQVKANQGAENSALKEPKALFEKLSNAKKKIDLFNSLNYVMDNERFSQDAITWSDEYAEELQRSLDDATGAYATDETTDTMYFGTDISEYYRKKIEDRKNGETYSFHNPVFDSLITEGPTPGHGGIIGGSTGMGKSALCLNVINDLINADVPTMYFPIEMGLENTIDRLAAIRTGYPFKDIVRIGKNGFANTELEKEILHEIDGLRAHPNFAIVDKPNLNMKKLRSYIKRFQAKLPGRKYCIVFIDLLLMIKEFYDDGSNMAQMIERAINKLDILAKELGVHWVGVVQLNRSVEADKVLSEQAINKLKPTRSAIKNSSALLERARWAVTVFRKRYFADLYLTEEEAEGIDDVAEIQLMKANDESISRRYMTFDGPTFKMTENKDYGKSANGF